MECWRSLRLPYKRYSSSSGRCSILLPAAVKEVAVAEVAVAEVAAAIATMIMAMVTAIFDRLSTPVVFQYFWQEPRLLSHSFGSCFHL